VAVAQLGSKKTVLSPFDPGNGTCFSVANNPIQTTFSALLHQQVPQQNKVQQRLFSVLECCFTPPFQQSFEVEAGGCYEQAFIGELYAPGVHPSHAQEVDQRANHQFDGTRWHFFIIGILCVGILEVLFIGELLLLTLAFIQYISS
jgi:hypothetical protein